MSERSWWKNIAWWQTTVHSLSWLTKLKAWSVMKTICLFCHAAGDCAQAGNNYKIVGEAMINMALLFLSQETC